MPSSLLRPCATPGCPTLTAQARCQEHTREYEARRGTPLERGYNAAWRDFRRRFKDTLIHHGIAPVCGAALTGGPLMADSRCKAAGLLNDRALHLHHDPPLQPHERKDTAVICNSLRVGFLCRSCHARATQGQQQAGLV